MPPAPDPLTNPYAPPAAPQVTGVDADEPGGRSASRYDDERRSVVVLLLLAIVTFGAYPSIWYARRARFLDSLDARKKVGALPWVYVVLTGALFITAVARAGGEVGRILEIATGLFSLFLAFRVADMLQSDLARSGRLIGISGVGVFFFGCVYLQHIINEAADTPPRKARRAA